MLEVKPWFYDDFSCTASACTDTCCVGWEIDVDEATYSAYKKDSTPFGQEVLKNITVAPDGTKSFVLCEGERCPFLDENNLCKIIINRSEKALCDICREHPRFYNDFFCAEESGLGLCCEEVCKLLLKGDKPFTLIKSGGISKNVEAEEAEELSQYIKISKLRDALLDILNSDIAFEEKLEKIISVTDEKIKFKSFRELVNIYCSTEPVNSEWERFSEALSLGVTEYSKNEKSFDSAVDNNKPYSKILSYIIYRNLIPAVYDGLLKERLAFCVESLSFIKLCDIKAFTDNGVLTFTDRVNNLKMWSKQIEYSDENLSLLIEG